MKFDVLEIQEHEGQKLFYSEKKEEEKSYLDCGINYRFDDGKFCL